MNWIEAIPGVGSIFITVRDIIRNYKLDPNDSEKLAAEITLAFADVLKQEIGSQYWLAGNWRPLVMLLIAAGLTAKSIVGNVFDVSSDYVLFSLLVMGLLGYKLDGRILEFVAAVFALGKKETKNGNTKKGHNDPSAP